MENELIKITTNDEGKQLVSARELHEFLEVKSRFNDWISNRIKKYDFVENEDYICLTKNLVTQTQEGKKGIAKETDYAMTIDMAKELSMVENNDKGSQARKYFIECEKKLKEKQQLQLPKDYLSALKALVVSEEEKQKLQEENKIMLPKAEFYDAVTDSKDAIPMAQVAKVLGIKGLGRNKLFQLLRDKKLLRSNNEPMQSYCDAGYFRVVETRYTVNGDTKINLKTLVTQKGLDYIRKIV